MRRQPQEGSWPGPALSPPGHSFPAHRSIASWLLPTPSLVSFLLILQVLCGQDICSDCLGRAPPPFHPIYGKQPVSQSQICYPLWAVGCSLFTQGISWVPQAMMRQFCSLLVAAWSDVWHLHIAALKSGRNLLPSWHGAGVGEPPSPTFPGARCLGGV